MTDDPFDPFDDALALVNGVFGPPRAPSGRGDRSGEDVWRAGPAARQDPRGTGDPRPQPPPGRNRPGRPAAAGATAPAQRDTGPGGPLPAKRPSPGGRTAPGRTGAAPAADHRVRRDPDWDTARDLAHHTFRPLLPVPRTLDRVLGHTLARPLTALTDLPAFDTSAMDGWAVAGPGPWRLDEGDRVLAGRPAARPLTDGRAVPIATGARIPEGATAVLRSEHGRPGRGHLHGPGPEPGTDIRPRGQECRTGAELLPAGSVLTPAALGLAAAAGYDELTVHPRPRAEVLILGDELLHRGLPHDGRIRDALGPMTGPWLTSLGADVLVTRRLGDDAEALFEAVATTRADLVVTTGGTASGPVDHVHPTLHRLGAELLVHGVAVRPGHPMLLARLPGGVPLIGLPGNPLAAVSGLLTLAAPLLRALSGRPAPEDRWARLTDPPRPHPRSTRLVPVGILEDGTARPLSYAGPAMLRGIAAASALAVVPAGAEDAPPGHVRILELPRA
ncbi:molybdopterin-binding protein [Streptomyces sodiiphilus]|uniref:Molybdopterin molybdenumtransferase n=1 Tax=Streptomyces sodiiphilus TaxID=226217 RepID=A0ABN2PID6_9ACTN